MEVRNMDVKEAAVLPQVTKHLNYWLGQATYEHVRDGLKWYADMHSEMVAMSREFNAPLDVVCAVTATLSPMVEWSMNLRATRGILATGELKLENGKRVPVMHQNTSKALEIYKTGNVGLVTGRKVPQFYNTLLDPMYEDVTVDQWMVRAGGFLLEWKKSPGPRIIRVVKAAVRDIAHRRGYRSPQIQAVIWSSIKDRKDWREQIQRMGPVNI
jgi:hypothetical protein